MKSQQYRPDTNGTEKKRAFFINKPAKNKITIVKMQQKAMFEEIYSLNQHMMSMVGFYDCHAKACTIVRETKRIFVVHQSPVEILEHSIKRVGFNLKGAMETSREANGSKMCPILVNPLLKLIVFPIHSASRVDTMWFNPDQILRTSGSKGSNRKTNIEFKNGFILKIDSRLSSFNDKRKRAEQYRDAKIAEAKHPFSFHTSKNSGKILFTILVALKCLTEIAEVIQ